MKSEKFDSFEKPKNLDWRDWNVQKQDMSLDSPIYVTTPDGIQYRAGKGWWFKLVPDRPEGDKMPEPFMQSPDGKLIPFEEWASNSYTIEHDL